MGETIVKNSNQEMVLSQEYLVNKTANTAWQSYAEIQIKKTLVKRVKKEHYEKNARK